MQQKSDKHKERDKEESCAADIPSPISDPPPYDSVGHDHNENAHESVSTFKNYTDDSHELRDESTAPLLGICEPTRRYALNLTLYLICKFWGLPVLQQIKI